MPKVCVQCRHLKRTRPYYYCEKFGWYIKPELAKTQALCNFEWHHRLPDGRAVITSGVAPHLLLLENEKLQNQKRGASG